MKMKIKIQKNRRRMKTTFYNVIPKTIITTKGGQYGCVIVAKSFRTEHTHTHIENEIKKKKIIKECFTAQYNEHDAKAL